jgi:hypothetical protein
MALVLLSIAPKTFTFKELKASTQTVSDFLSGPEGFDTATILLQNFNFAYADGKQYGFGQFAVSLAVVKEGARWKAVCSATLSDDKRDQRKWGGSVLAVVHFYRTVRE